MSAAVAESPGWRASLELGFGPLGGRTVPTHRRHSGPLRVQKAFHPEPGVCHSYILHPPGGVVGGDRLNTTVDVKPGAHALITTPGAAKFYRSAGPVACQRQSLRVAAGATLEWLPLEQIVFDGAQVEANLLVELEAGARFIGWELTCLGRPAAAAPFRSGRFDAWMQLHRDEVPLLHERSDYAAGSDLLRARGDSMARRRAASCWPPVPMTRRWPPSGA
ncbi:MAG: urease accessory protein UreD [Arhodomonas sp.]|nr:urease accessory protein UreD [Arhodomonas sp.]